MGTIFPWLISFAAVVAISIIVAIVDHITKKR